MTGKDVAEGYGLSRNSLSMAKQRNADELIEGKHWVVTDSDTLGGKQKVVMWTKRGVVRLGFFIKTPMTKEFLESIENQTQENLSLLKKVCRGKDNKGTWVHPAIFVDIAMWLNPEFKAIGCLK